jgi:hypothetical protein
VLAHEFLEHGIFRLGALSALQRRGEARYLHVEKVPDPAAVSTTDVSE